METEQKKAAVEKLSMAKMIDQRLPGIKGKWRLYYKAKGSRGIENFGGVTIHDYTSPFTHQNIHRRDANGKALPLFFLDKASKDFYPDRNLQDKLDIAWFLHSPQIQIEGYDQVPEKWLEQKITSSPIFLVAVDYKELGDIEQDDYIDKLLGKLSEDGVRGVSLDKLRMILAAVGLNYTDNRFDVPAVEKKVLRNNLKKWVRKDYENAKAVNKILASEDYYQVEFEMKEMMRLKIIKDSANGVYKYNDIPMGTHPSTILDFWTSNPEIKMEMMKELANKSK